jgi:hypothetical protein
MKAQGSGINPRQRDKVLEKAIKEGREGKGI